LFSKSLSLCSSKWKTKFHTQRAHLAKLVFYILNFIFLWDGQTKDFGLNDGKHSLNLIYSWFHHECHSHLCHPQEFEFCYIFKRFISYPYILVLSWVQMMRHILCLLCIISRPVSLLACKRVYVFYLWYLYYRPTN
jgi:hypothetical protein